MKKLALRTALTMVVLTAVAITALLIHLSWNYVARKNTSDIVAQLNRQIVGSVHREFFAANYNVAWSTQETLRAILTANPEFGRDDRKTQALFLSLLQSQPGLSRIAMARANGDLVGIHRLGDGGIDFEVLNAQRGRLDTERFAVEEGRLTLRERFSVAAPFNAAEQSWYQGANDSGEMTSSMVPSLPGSPRPALCFATPLAESGQPSSVLLVAIDLDHLGLFLDGLQVGKSGTVAVLSKDGSVVAAADASAREQLGGGMRDIADMAKTNRLLKILKQQLDSGDPVLTTLSEPREFQVWPSGEKGSYFLNFSSLSFEGWIVATIIPGSDFLAEIDRNSEILAAVLVVATLVMALAAVLLADRLFALPLLRITDQLRHIETFDLGSVRRLSSPLRELDGLSAALAQMSRGLASFQKYMPTNLVRTLVSQGIEARPGGAEQDLTVLFCDIAGFSGLSEELGVGIVPLLTDYLTLASSAIVARDGTIDKFIGDAVMAFWGAPVANAHHAVDSCAAALDLQARMRTQREIWQKAGHPQLRARIGINSGTMLVGNIGSHERLNYTVIGDAVNVSSRLESLNKRYGTEIMIGEATRHAAGDAILVRRLDLVSVYGRTRGTAVFELLGMAEAGPPPAWVALYESALEDYARRDWRSAILAFSQVVAERGGDVPSELFIERCQALLADPPGQAWSPVIALDSK